MSSTSLLPPRRALFADPAAAIVWQAIIALPVASQHLVLEELRERLASAVVPSSPHATRLARAVGALREAAELLDGPPSIPAYERLRGEHPEWGWPPAGTIRTWLGHASWNDCLRHARLDAVAGADTLTIANGPAFTSAEGIAALQECAADLGGAPSFAEYLGWARRDDVRRRPGRRPFSQGTFERLFGGFTSALTSAGLISGPADAALVRNGTVRMARYFVDDDAIVASLREVAERLGRAPRTTDYQRERQRIIQESAAAGAPRTIASYATVHSRFPVWDDALKAAGLRPLGGRATGQGRKGKVGPAGTKVSDAQIAADLREAFSALGEPFTVAAFKDWRAAQLERDKENGVRRRIASHHTIWQRHGTWENACLAAGIRPGASA